MKLDEIQEIKGILPEDRTLFYYFKDRYALMLLENVVEDSINISTLKKSRLASLLSKPVFKSLLQQAGNGALTLEQIQALWPVSTKVFSLTLDSWGDDCGAQQTTRNEGNLVLQLNFSNEHRQKYRSLVNEYDCYRINNVNHPVHNDVSQGGKKDTLAWARIDLDLDTGEALIEEIQCDFIRDVKEFYDALEKITDTTDTYLRNANLKRYYEEVLSEYRKIWDEAMLAACIDFLVRELGIKHVYYHRWETGMKLKNMTRSPPPKSLYTTLPRRFCFEKTEQTPQFLYKNKEFRRLAKKMGKLQWFKLPLQVA